MVEEDGLLVHKSQADGKWSRLKHPLANLAEYLKGKSGDPFPIPNANPDRDWAEFIKYKGEGRTGLQILTHTIQPLFILGPGGGSATVSITATASAESFFQGGGTSSITLTGSADGTISQFVNNLSNAQVVLTTNTTNPFITLSGEGAASVVLTGTANGLPNTSGGGSSDISITASANGVGIYRTTGSASIEIGGAASVGLSGGGTALVEVGSTTSASVFVNVFTPSSTADVSVTAIGNGSKAAPGAGTAAIAITSTATASAVNLQGSGTSSVAITSTAQESVLRSGAGTASVAITATADGVEAGTIPNGILTFNGSGTFSRVIPPGVTKLMIEVWGDHVSTTTTTSGGGAYSKIFSKTVVPGSTLSYTYGSGTDSVSTVDALSAGAYRTGGLGGLASGGNINLAGLSSPNGGFRPYAPADPDTNPVLTLYTVPGYAKSSYVSTQPAFAFTYLPDSVIETFDNWSTSAPYVPVGGSFKGITWSITNASSSGSDFGIGNPVDHSSNTSSDGGFYSKRSLRMFPLTNSTDTVIECTGVNLTGYSNVKLNVYRTNTTTCVLRVRNNDGSISTLSPNAATTFAWETLTVPLSAFSDKSNLKIALILRSSGSGNSTYFDLLYAD